MNVQIIKATKEKHKVVKTSERRQRVAGYARVSTENDIQISSLDNQKKYLKQKIESNENWELVEIYADEGISGTNAVTRPAFMKMIKDASNGKIDLIITKSISRFARNTYDALNYIKMLSDKKVYIIFEEENINTMKVDNELLITVLTAVAQQESINISEHIKKAQLIKMQRGEFCGTLKCFGYDYSKENKQIYINSDQAEIVKKIFNLYLEDNGTLKIAKILTSEGIPNISGGKYWREETISKILKNEKYTGDLILGKYYTIDSLSHCLKKNNGERDQYLIRNHHDAIISRNQFNAVQEEMATRYAKRNHVGYSHQSRYAFSGKIKCGFCGNTVKRIKTHNSIKKARYCCSYGMNLTVYKCEYSKAQSEEILKKAFMQAANRLRNNIKLEHRFSNKENNKISYAREILINKEIDIEKFDPDLFEKLIKIVILGETDEKGKEQPYTVRFIINTENNPFLSQIINGKINLDNLKTKDLIDFYSNQMWQDFNKKGLAEYHNRFRVLVSYEIGEN